MKGISPIISTIILIVIVFAIAAIIVPWGLELARNTTTTTSNVTQTQLLCQGAALTWDTSYGRSGLIWNFSGSSDSLSAKIVNSGTVSLFGFSFELQVNKTIYRFYPTADSQIWSYNPLRPGQSAILIANISQNLENALENVKILNSQCPEISIAQEV
jgi:flagellin-like protein